MRIDNHLKKVIQTLMKHAGYECASDNLEIILLAGGGSDRSFFRINNPFGSFVVMTSPKFTHEIRAYVDVADFLCKNGIGAPGIIAYDDEKHMVLMEDLGDGSFYLILKNSDTREDVIKLYKRVLEFCSEMHGRASPSIETCNYLKNRAFGYEALRWETDYFLECFIKRFAGIVLNNETEIEGEFHRLALTLEREPRYFMHRDFQSQNIYFKDDRVRIIDFQAATRGLLQYDLASLLKDAYFPLDAKERELLLHYYIDLLDKTRDMKINRVSFIETFHLAGLQRNMQALGAFAFLSMDKGKTGFLQHIPNALAYLQDTLSMFSEFPELRGAVEKATDTLQKKNLPTRSKKK